MTKTIWPLTQSPISAIILDMDDTLYLERDFVLSGFRAVSIWGEQQLNINKDEGYEALKKLFDDGVRGRNFNAWLSMFNIPECDHLASLIDVYRTHLPTIAPIPRMKQFVERASQIVPLGLISDGYLAVQQQKLKALQLNPYFQTVVFSDQFGRENWKPSPIPYKYALAKLGVASTDAVYIGDNALKDFIGARQLGVKTIHIKHSGRLYTHIPPSPQHKADIEVENSEELLELFHIQ